MTDFQPVSPKNRISRLQISDIEAVARLVAEKRLTETESCLVVGVKYQTFAQWKCRNGNSPKFEEVVTRLRAAKINNVIDSIDKAGEPFTYQANGKEYSKPGDWRAKAWIAERALAPDRYGQRDSQQQVNNTLVIGDSAAQAILDKVFGGQPKPVVDCPQHKQLNSNKVD